MGQWWLTELLLALHITYSCAKNCMKIHPCPGDQFCDETTGNCECPKGRVLVGDKCEAAEPSSSDSGQTAIIVIAVLLCISLMSTGLFLIIRKYQLVDWLRQRIEARRNHDVLYEDVMIGQDDPPLAL